MKLNSHLLGFFILAGVLSASGCGLVGEPVTSGTDQSEVVAEDSDSDGSEEAAGGSDGASTGTIPSGARAASDDFPIPVPEDWVEIFPFGETELGKDPAMAAAYEYPGDAEAASAAYEAILVEAGFTITQDLLGQVTNAAAIYIEGDVGGIFYKGGAQFDSNAEGQQVVNLLFTES